MCKTASYNQFSHVWWLPLVDSCVHYKFMRFSKLVWKSGALRPLSKPPL